MLKPNFKKMYLVSEEKIQALTTNLSRGNLSNIDIRSYHNLKDGLNNTDQNQNKLLNSSQGQSNNTSNNTIQKGVSLNNKRDEKEPPLPSNKTTTDQATQTDTTPATPFRKIFTRKYKFRGRTPIQENLRSKRKRKSCEMNLYHENNQSLPIKRKKQIKNSSIHPGDDTNRRKILRQKTNWLKLH